MTERVCVGGINLETSKSVRLLTSYGKNQPADTPLEIGQVWDIDYAIPRELFPPHMEDVLVNRCTLVDGTCRHIRGFIVKHMHPWEGSLVDTFDKKLNYTHGYKKGYIHQDSGIPSVSTGFWSPNSHLILKNMYDKNVFAYRDMSGVTYHIPYVGVEPPPEIIPVGSLVRLSLARWWKPEEKEEDKKCYLQLSGWYQE